MSKAELLLQELKNEYSTHESLMREFFNLVIVSGWCWEDEFFEMLEVFILFNKNKNEKSK